MKNSHKIEKILNNYVENGHLSKEEYNELLKANFTILAIGSIPFTIWGCIKILNYVITYFF